jgi:hypothetical protein
VDWGVVMGSVLVAALAVIYIVAYIIVLKGTDMGLIDAWLTTGCTLMSLSVITVLVMGILLGVPFWIWRSLSSFIGGS